MIKEFKEFIMRGSAMDLAVGVVIGGAFTSIVNSIVDGLITPLVEWLIHLLIGKDDFSGLNVEPVAGVTLKFGNVITAIITFIITAFVLFLIVKSFNKAKTVLDKQPTEEASVTTPTEEYLKEIRDLLEAQQTSPNSEVSNTNQTSPK